jgi:hypothetical protein
LADLITSLEEAQQAGRLTQRLKTLIFPARESGSGQDRWESWYQIQNCHHHRRQRTPPL